MNCQTGKTENRAQGVAEPQSPGATGTEVCLDLTLPPSSDPIDCTARATTPVVGEDVKDGARSI